MVTVTQFSDTHFSRPGNRSHGGFGYDTDASWEAVYQSAYGSGATELTVVTGDVADHGEADEYLIAAANLKRVPTPTNILAGNHDFQVPLQATVPRPGLTMDRVQRVGPWLFVFADSNGDGRTVAEDGRMVDRTDRIESNGALGPAEMSWIDETIATSNAEFVWLWMHHPPAMDDTAFHRPLFDAEIVALIDVHPKIRGVGAGHVHTSAVKRIKGRPIYLCPALTINIDFDVWTTLPPGYRTYAFDDNGTVTSESHFVDDERWPRIELPEPAIRHFKGELTWEEMVAALPSLPIS